MNLEDSLDIIHNRAETNKYMAPQVYRLAFNNLTFEYGAVESNIYVPLGIPTLTYMTTHFRETLKIDADNNLEFMRDARVISFIKFYMLAQCKATDPVNAVDMYFRWAKPDSSSYVTTGQDRYQFPTYIEGSANFNIYKTINYTIDFYASDATHVIKPMIYLSNPTKIRTVLSGINIYLMVFPDLIH